MVAMQNTPNFDPLANTDVAVDLPVTLPLKVRSPTSSGALAQVRAKLGDDAIIVATRTIRDPNTGQRLVEVEATLEDTPAADLAPPRAANTRPPSPARGQLFRSPALGATTKPTEGDDVANAMLRVLDELRELRSEVRVQKEESAAAFREVRSLRGELRDIENVVSSLTSEHAIIREYGIPAEWVPAYRRLLAASIDPVLAEELVKATIATSGVAPADAVAASEALVDAVASRLKIKPILGQAMSPPVISVVGPGGAGKTSMVAKIAAHAVLRGTTSVGIVVSEPAGSLEPLSRVAGALGIPITAAVSGPGALARAICAMQADGVELVLVDTPACRIGDADLNAAIWRDLTTIPASEILLVLPATMRDLDLNNAARELARLGFHRFAFSHVDETLRTGALLTAVSSTGRPIAALSSGPRIPDDLVLPDPKAMAMTMVRPPRVSPAKKGK